MNNFKRESKIEKDIIRFLKSKYPNCYITKGNPNNNKGVHDRIVCIRGKFITIEVKKAGGKIKETQKIHKRLVEKAGGYSLITDNLDDLKNFLKEIGL